MLSTSTWADFKSLVEAQVGSTLSSGQDSRLQALANLAASRAYRAHRFWPRFLVAGEPRTLLRNYVAFSEDSFHVYGSGTDNVDGLYVADGSNYIKKKSDGTTEYTIKAVDGVVVAGAGTTVNNGVYEKTSSFLYTKFVDGVLVRIENEEGTFVPPSTYTDEWVINGDYTSGVVTNAVENISPDEVATWSTTGDGVAPVPTVALVTWVIEDTTGAAVYYNDSVSATPPLSGWAKVTGTDPAPLLVDVANIDTFYDVQINGFQIAGTGGWNADKLVSSKGCYVEVGNADVDEVYVTYKASHTSKYGDGTGGTTSDIPDEWFEYMALYTARQIQIGSRQGNGSPYAVIASREVEAALEDEMMKIEEQGIVDNLGRRIETGILNSTMLS